MRWRQFDTRSAAADPETLYDRPHEWSELRDLWKTDRFEPDIDGVALSGEGELLVGECKWGSVDTHDLRTLERSARKLLEELYAK